MDNYYELFSLDRSLDTEQIRKKLLDEKKKQINRQNNAPTTDKRYAAEKLLEKITEAEKVFESAASKKRYDQALFGNTALPKPTKVVTPASHENNKNKEKPQDKQPESYKDTPQYYDTSPAVNGRFFLIMVVGALLLSGVFALEESAHPYYAFFLAIVTPLAIIVTGKLMDNAVYEQFGQSFPKTLISFIAMMLPVFFVARRGHTLFIIIYLIYAGIIFLKAMGNNLGVIMIFAAFTAALVPCILLKFSLIYLAMALLIFIGIAFVVLDTKLS